MFGIAKILGGTLAATVMSTALISGGSAFAAGTNQATAPVVRSDEAHDKVHYAALDAFRQTLNDLVKDGKLTTLQRDAIMDAVKKADWDGFSVERLGDILGGLVKNDVITAAQRDAILDAVSHADHRYDRFVRVLDRLADHGVISRGQKDAIVDAVKKADWDGFSIERLGDILGGLVQNGTLSAAQRDAIMDGMGRK